MPADGNAWSAALGATRSDLSEPSDEQGLTALPRDALLAIVQHLSPTNRQHFRLVSSRWAAICNKALNQESVVAHLEPDLPTWQRQVAFYGGLQPPIRRLVLISTKPKEQLRQQLAILAQICTQVCSLTIHHLLEPRIPPGEEAQIGDVYVVSDIKDLHVDGLWPLVPDQHDGSAALEPIPTTKYWLQDGPHDTDTPVSMQEQDKVARHIAMLIRHSSVLSLNTKARLLGWSCEHTKVLDHFINSFDFAHQSTADALRHMLSTVRLPGDTSRLSKIIEQFAARCYEQNPRCGLADADAVYVQAYSLIMRP